MYTIFYFLWLRLFPRAFHGRIQFNKLPQNRWSKNHNLSTKRGRKMVVYTSLRSIALLITVVVEIPTVESNMAYQKIA